AHGDGRGGDDGVSFKKPAIVHAGTLRKLHDVAAAIERCPRFVEADVPVSPYPQQLQIDTTALLHFCGVLLAVPVQIMRQTVGEVKAGSVKVKVLEQMLAHISTIAFWMPRA